MMQTSWNWKYFPWCENRSWVHALRNMSRVSMKRSRTQERFSHQGKYFQFQDVCIMPKPYQKPHPPLRIAAPTPETYPLVGRLGAPLFVAVRTVSLSDLKRHLPTYQAAWTASGHAGRGDVGVSVPLHARRD